MFFCLTNKGRWKRRYIFFDFTSWFILVGL